MICVGAGFLGITIGVTSVRRGTVHDVLLYAGGVLLPLGVVLLITWAVAASRENHQQAAAARRGFEVLGLGQSAERLQDEGSPRN